jgi:hypothetical protein
MRDGRRHAAKELIEFDPLILSQEVLQLTSQRGEEQVAAIAAGESVGGVLLDGRGGEGRGRAAAHPFGKDRGERGFIRIVIGGSADEDVTVAAAVENAGRGAGDEQVVAGAAGEAPFDTM